MARRRSGGAGRASYGHVSNVRKALLAREWIEVADRGIVLVQPDVPAANLARELSAPDRRIHHRIYPSPWNAAQRAAQGHAQPASRAPARPLCAALGRAVACALRTQRHPYALRRRAGRRRAEGRIEADARRKGRERGAARPDGREPVSRRKRARAKRVLHQSHRDLSRSLDRQRPRPGRRRNIWRESSSHG